ncbi:hypothetical protein FB45DRAFT_32073 [Roridomyces roridus]|uniref:F-box domain-containing protein n=1 Tax=Roridomyces roridus TaxID=1738132 RepID=A0AAD7CLC1_9AGAR|nr:hypothetical protein FB45DRAFT_32073 [Roridomyces roridus]
MASNTSQSPQRSPVGMTERLPNELLTEIVEYLPRRADQASLCLISKLFHDVSLPFFDRTVVLPMTRSRQLKAFFRSIIAHPERADATRSLTFTNQTSLLDFNPFFYDLLIESTRLMKNLEHLRVQDWSETATMTEPSIISCLAFLTFPCLSTCRIEILPVAQGLGSNCHVAIGDFLERHPTITHLRLWPYGGFHDPTHTGALLPRLEHYDGNLHFLTMLSSRCLRAARFPWVLDWEEIDSPLEALPSLLDARLPTVLSFDDSCPSYNAIPSTLSALPDYIPNLTSLKICARSMRVHSQTSVLNCLKECLPRFSGLKYIAFEHSDPTLVSTNDDLLALQAWADVTPSFKACSIRQRAWRKVDGLWEEYREEEFDVEAGFSAFAKCV